MKYKDLIKLLERDLGQYIKKIINEEIKPIRKEIIKTNQILESINSNKIITSNEINPLVKKEEIRSKYRQLIEGTSEKNNLAEHLIENVEMPGNITLTGHETIANSPETIKKAIEIQTKDYRGLLKKCH